jgi:streptogramin lyase
MMRANIPCVRWISRWGKFKVFRPSPSPNIYDIISDSQNNEYFTVFGADQIGRIDAKTGKIELYKTPMPNSAPHRGSMDSHGHLWFAEFRGNLIGMFDTEAQHFQEWTPPTPWAKVGVFLRSRPEDALCPTNCCGSRWFVA